MIAPLLLAAVLAAAPGPSLAVEGGGTGLYTQADADAQLVALTLVLDGGTAYQSAAQNGLAALAAETILHTKIDGIALQDRIVADGGTIDFTVDPSVVRFSIEALPDALPAIAHDVAQALAAPDTSGATIAAARAELADRIADDERNPLVVGLEMLHGSFYVGGAGQPALGTGATVAGLTGTDVATFIGQHYRRGGAFVSAAGRIDDHSRVAAQSILDALPAGAVPAAQITLRPPDAAGKQIIAHRDIGIPVVMVGFAAPALGDPDFAAMLVVRAMIDRVSQRVTSTTVDPFERGIAAIYDYDVKPATFTVAFNGGRLDPPTAIAAMQALLHDLATKPLDASELQQYRQTARGAWALEAVSLPDRAWQVGAAVEQGAAPDLASAVGAQIDQVSADDVERVARTYLQHSTIALVLPREEE